MSIEIAPAFRVDTVRTHLHRDRGYALPHSDAERFAEALLDECSAKVRIGAPKQPLTGADLAAMVEAAEKAAHSPDPSACECGHRWSDHVGRAGCMECDGCRKRSPQRDVPWQPRVLPSTFEVARAYDDDGRHFPQAGAR